MNLRSASDRLRRFVFRSWRHLLRRLIPGRSLARRFDPRAWRFRLRAAPLAGEVALGPDRRSRHRQLGESAALTMHSSARVVSAELHPDAEPVVRDAIRRFDDGEHFASLARMSADGVLLAARIKETGGATEAEHLVVVGPAGDWSTNPAAGWIKRSG